MVSRLLFGDVSMLTWHCPAVRPLAPVSFVFDQRSAAFSPVSLNLQYLGYVVVAMDTLALRRSGLCVLLPLEVVPCVLALGLISLLWLHDEVLLILHLRG